eukprot:gene8836-784_t
MSNVEEQNFSKEISKLHGKLFLKEKSKKIILIFGWFGSTHKLLSKYTEIYNKNNCSVIQFIPSNFNITDTNHYEKKIQKLVLVLEQKYKIGEEKMKFFCHCFSNHGLKNVIVLSKLIQEKKILCVELSGVISDSTPVDLTPKAASNALTASIKMNHIKSILYYFMYFIFYLFFLIYEFLTKSTVNEGVGFDGLLENEKLSIFFIYSESDNITDFKFLENFIEKFKGKKKVQKFENSNHVSHLMIHPEKYTKEVVSFVTEN